MRNAAVALLALLLVAQTPAPVPSPAASSPPNIWRIGSFVDTALAAPTLRGAHVGVLAVDAASGAVLYAKNADDAFVPASTMKLVTGSVALARLGPDFTFATDVDAAGTIDGGALHGDLYLRGGGDAELNSSDLDAAAAAVVAAGIRHVSGSLIGDASRYRAPHLPDGWTIDDVPNGYAAVPSALSLDFNVAHVRVAPGEAPGSPARLQIAAPSSAFTIDNATTTGAAGSDDSTGVERPWNLPETIRVTGSYPMGAALSDDLAPAVPDPPAYALDAFRNALERAGVSIGDGTHFGIAPSGATVVWTHRSKPLRALLRDFWPPSNSLLGEQLLEEIGSDFGTRGGDDSRERGIAAEQSWLTSIGVDTTTLTIADGSGVSLYDRLTPRTLTAVLAADWQSDGRQAVLDALPLSGERGTLKSTFAADPLRGAIFAKTGTDYHGRLLAGYAKTERGGTVIFALMINNWMDASDGAQAALDAARAGVLQALVAS